MKILSFTRLFFITFCFTFININLYSQENKETKEIDAIVNLSRFVDWSQNKSFSQNERKLYVLADKKTLKKVEITRKNTSIYFGWKIVLLNELVDFEEGSVVFITQSKVKDIDEIIMISANKNILTISENIDDFCKRGGMINIKENKGQVKFEINYRNIQDKSLDISSKLLALSKIYE